MLNFQSLPTIEHIVKKIIFNTDLFYIRKTSTFVPRIQQRLSDLENHLIKDISRDGSATADRRAHIRHGGHRFESKKICL